MSLSDKINRICETCKKNVAKCPYDVLEVDKVRDAVKELKEYFEKWTEDSKIGAIPFRTKFKEIFGEKLI